MMQSDVSLAKPLPAPGKVDWAAVAVALGCGIALRLAWPFDIEYKADERWTFEQVQTLLGGGAWRWVGMPTSFGPPNPGLSLWFFAALAWLFNPETPPQLARLVQWVNVGALFSFVAFARLVVPTPRRVLWLWAAALWAVNPVAVIYERKIWPPSALPILTVALIAVWWFRRRPVPAILWGVIGALMAQLHLGAGLFAFALALWTAMTDWRQTRWLAWVAGSALGAVPMLPWLSDVLTRHHEFLVRVRLPIAQFFPRWFSQPFGLGLHSFALDQAIDFLTFPTLFGIHTYLIGLLYVVLVVLYVWTLFQLAATTSRRGLPSASRVFLGDTPELVLTNSALWGYGGLMTLLTSVGLDLARNYLIVVAPLTALWASMLVQEWALPSDRRTARRLLAAFCIAQALISLGALGYIHEVQVIHGEYGPTWRSQQPAP